MGIESQKKYIYWTKVVGVLFMEDPAMLSRYEQLLSSHTAKRAIIIIARKLLSRIYFVLKNKQNYELGIVK